MKAMFLSLKLLIPPRYRPIGYLVHLTRIRTGCRVLDGPFAGMRYVEDSVGSAYIPKLLGIYESELYEEVETICRQRPTLIVDVGAAEGFYAVGMAVRNAQAKVIAFEMDLLGRAALRKMSALNGVTDRVEVRAKCEPEDLKLALGDHPNPVVICDVEGYEEKLLDLKSIPGLTHATILVELHDCIIPGITEKLRQRFGATHQIKHILQQPRSRAQFPWQTLGTRLLPKSYLDWTVSEWRAVKMAWFFLEPNQIP
jgi:hypothetical protein